MQKYLELLNSNLIYDNSVINNDILIISAHIKTDTSLKLHSKQVRKVKDIPYGEYKVLLLVTVNRYFIEPRKSRRTKMDILDFVSSTKRRTKRLDDSLFKFQKEMSFIGTERMIKEKYADVSDSTIIRMIKKNQL